MKEDTLILTCKLGNAIINCYDGTHNKEQLKKWASKKILLCPACGKPYEYCHGEVKTPYFRHMDKNECEDKYSESETEEHLNGKRDLFEWIKKQNGVTKAVLEGWIPGTKQRPDIMFEHDGKQYVIEYQCSPIATEYVERHALYKTAGINDIWICGTEKYLKSKMREKYLEQYSIGFYDSEAKEFIISKYLKIHRFLDALKINHNNISKKKSYDKNYNYYTCKLDNVVFTVNRFIEPIYFRNIDFDESINIHNNRYKRKNNDDEIQNLNVEEKFENILKRYCDSLNGISYRKTPCNYGNSNNRYEIVDNYNQYNEYLLSFNYSKDTYEQLKAINTSVKRVLDRRKYLFILNHLNIIFKNKLHGEYNIDYKNFGSGEYIDIEYSQFTIRSVIRELCLDISIHNPDGYMKRNYCLYQFSNYGKYREVISDIIKYANIIFDNNLKVRNALNKIVEFSNDSWEFCYSISQFNLVEIKLYPIDDKHNKWDSIGLLKINANLDKNIDLELSTDNEIFDYIKEYFHKKLLRFFKTGIKSYYTDKERLITICHKEVKDN